ncbi:MAG: monofunctional biosynthetic peptidoglycan transglycosylase [Gemmatimonadetes bacterium]|nr:monofunctional biosynthetic peptidoglycan transglycosylase [Gemmatimonadota bacterium]
MTLRRLVLVVCAILAASAGATLLYATLSWPEVRRLARERPTTTAFIERTRAELRRAGKPDRVEWRWVPDDAISPHLKRAVITSEDIGFFSHHGFALEEMRQALSEAVRERAAPRGASTITQQLAKNLWLSPSRNPLRKLKEAILTRQLERALTKRRILELYLNVVQFGPGVYGAEAAARHYFDQPAADLSEHEAALLAAGLPRPRAWNPASGSRWYHRQVARIEGRMARATFLWSQLGQKRPTPDAAALADSALAAFLRSDTLSPSEIFADSIDADSSGAPDPGVR